MIRFWRKSYAVILLGVALAMAVAGGIWLGSLNTRISEGLKAKKFLPPTEYFTGPEMIYPQMLISRAAMVQKLSARHYSEKNLQQRLRPGEFAQGTGNDCAQVLPSPLPEDAAACVLFAAKDVGDPELSSVPLQMLIFSSHDIPLQGYQGNPLVPASSVFLEPVVFAQYLDKEPIEQVYTPLGEMPTACLNAVLAIEDPRFLEHNGVSLSAIARAAFRNLTGSRFTQGGSTITQQLVKNYFLTAEHSYRRKLTEFFMSLLLEGQSSKDEIFATYLNIIYLGQNGPFQIRGFPAAAQFYFAKNIQELSLPDCALLAAVLNSPGLYDPFHKPENALKRRNLVLEKMAEHQFISSEESADAKTAALPKRSVVNVAETAPYYIDAVQREMSELSLPIMGMKIFTGLDLQAQSQAQNVVRANLAKLEEKNKLIKSLHAKGKSLEAVLLSADNRTGLVRAIVGGRSYGLTQFNRALDGHRQVGSVMKPFVYLAALESSRAEKSLTPTTIVHDTRFTYEYAHQTWSPENFGKEYMGDVPMYVALKNSLNCATASLGLEVGLDKIISVAQSAGITSRLEPVPSLTLGAFELSAKEVLQAYSTLANFGEKHHLRMVRALVNEQDQTVYTSHDVVEPAFAPEPAAELVSMMKQTLLTGTAKSSASLGFTYPAAGKTGTTSESKDSWFAGFTPFLTSIVWVGYDDNTPDGLTGASGALPIWVDFMKTATALDPPADFTWPAGMQKVVQPDGAELEFATAK